MPCCTDLFAFNAFAPPSGWSSISMSSETELLLQSVSARTFTVAVHPQCLTTTTPKVEVSCKKQCPARNIIVLLIRNKSV